MRNARRNAVVLAALVLFASAALGAEAAGDGHASLSERMTALVLQLGAILIAARLGAFVCRRWLRIPDVLGELGAGILLGPHLLGSRIGLFPVPVAGASMPFSAELYGIATLAAILLLYLAGLETDIALFLRYSVVGSAVGMGGVAVSFVFGNVVAVWTGLAPGYLSPAALFLGAISTATSVGITARVLSQRNRMDSPEGVTILSGAVVDDVLGIIVLAVVVGMCRRGETAVGIRWDAIAWIALKALGFWALCTGVGLLLSRRISKVLEWFGSPQTMATLSLGMALLLAGFAEKANLAMIIGAYIMGLSLSRVDTAHELRERLEPVCETLVAVFFTVMGMMVNLREVVPVLGVGVLYTLVGMGAKILGCGGPAWATRFNLRGALRVGVGMLPRGEVTLLMAGVGLAGGFITQEIFGVAVLMTLLCSLAAPLLMTRLFDHQPGVRRAAGTDGHRPSVPLTLGMPNPDIAEFMVGRILRMFEQEECYCHQLARGEHLYQIRKDAMILSLAYRDGTIIIQGDEGDREFARLVLLEALADLIHMFEGLREIQAADLRRHLA
ncbi:MAG: cation:proton antiporter [Lentisphaeria bacterium]|nr:cation:proton antiporter [Lentisphaeria bacterium]